MYTSLFRDSHKKKKNRDSIPNLSLVVFLFKNVEKIVSSDSSLMAIEILHVSPTRCPCGWITCFVQMYIRESITLTYVVVFFFTQFFFFYSFCVSWMLVHLVEAPINPKLAQKGRKSVQLESFFFFTIQEYNSLHLPTLGSSQFCLPNCLVKKNSPGIGRSTR